MIATLTGTLAARDPARIVVEAGGIGYEVFIPLTTFYRLPAPGNLVRLEIRQVVREDAITLYGFSDAADKRAFDLLMGVQHVGPKLALAILSVLEPAELVSAIAREDVEKIDAVPGVGPKVAERVVRELRDKTGELRLTGSVTAPRNGAAGPDGAAAGAPVDDAVSALINLGIKPAEAKKTVDAVIASDKAVAEDLEAMVRKSLAVLFGEK
jgi:Holliday junction DNA helicase RuvA